MPQYRKKPVVVEAERYTGWTSDLSEKFRNATSQSVSNGACEIITLEGTMRADPGDYIICGIKGEFYPCKPDIFTSTYELVES